MDNISQKTAKILLKIKAVSLSPKKPFRYSSGILSPIYTDCRILISHPKERKQIRDLYIQSINSSNKRFEVIAGTATAGIPHAAWIAQKQNLPMIYVRGKAKDHGKGNQIEGVIHKKQEAVIIEDLISTGESSVESARAIREVGAKADYIFSIMTYGMKKSQDNFKQNKIKHFSLTNFQDLVGVAQQLKYIKEDEKEIILEWAKDPAGWGKKMGFE